MELKGLWVSVEGNILTPGALNILLQNKYLRLIRRSAATLVVEDHGREVTLHWWPGNAHV